MYTYCKIPAQVGLVSLVGVSGKEYPYKFGNYFSFYNHGLSIRCLNMWAENLKEARVRFLDDGYVGGYLFSGVDRSWFIVSDSRIPDGWVNENLYWCGCSVPNDLELIKEMYSIYGDPNNELEQFTNPLEYHRKRGEEYIRHSDGFAIVRKKINKIDEYEYDIFHDSDVD